MRHLLPAILLLLCAGCSLDNVQKGETCPPAGIRNDAMAYYFRNADPAPLEGTVCPDEQPFCTAFTSEYNNGDYAGFFFCHTDCVAAISCDGICKSKTEASEACLKANEKNYATEADFVCIEGAKKCEGNSLSICKDNKWKTSHSCEFGCANNGCAECKIGELKCSDDNKSVLTCNIGKWETKEECLVRCESGACNETPEECNQNEKKCKDGSLYICTQGIWEELESCKNGCNQRSTECNECQPNQCKIMKDYLSSNYYCVNGKWHACQYYDSICPESCRPSIPVQPLPAGP